MIDVLLQREVYLRQRIIAKKSVGWDFRWDERERAALEWAISELGGKPISILEMKPTEGSDLARPD